MGGVYLFAGLAAGGVSLAVYLFTGGRLLRLGGMLGAMLPLLRGVTAPLQVYAPEAAALLGVLMTLAGWSLSLRPGGFVPALSLELIVGLACWAGGMRQSVWLFSPGIAALLALLLAALSGAIAGKIPLSKGTVKIMALVICAGGALLAILG